MRLLPLACASLFLLTATAALAQSPEAAQGSAAQHFELPRAPEDLDPILAMGVHVAAVFPVAREPLCPAAATKCVFGGGGGVGASLERRWPLGLSLGLAYDAWFLDSDTVYELGVMQMLSARLRQYWMRSDIFHPFLGGGVGALIFGDTLQIATVGVAVEATVGAEVELTESIGLTVALPWRFFTTSSFQTRRDRAERAVEPGVNVAASFQVGLVVTQTP